MFEIRLNIFNMTKPKLLNQNKGSLQEIFFVFSNPSELLLILFEVKSIIDEQIDVSESTIGIVN